MAGALALLLAAALMLEWRLASLGYAATVDDAESRWREQRLRANALGVRALVLIGASRIQLGVDLDELRRATQREPVQLAVDGSSFVSTLRGLAEDLAFKGSVLVDYYDRAVALAAVPDEAQRYEQTYEMSRAHWSGRHWEDLLANRLHERFRFFADGGRPLDALLRRAANPDPERQYLLTHSDRSKIADYQRVRMPHFYHLRVIATLDAELGRPTGLTADTADIASRLRIAVDAVEPAKNAVFQAETERVRGYVDAIARRGGNVTFVAMPTSGMVREILSRRYPDAEFRDRFAAHVGGRFIDANRRFAPGEFVCPDGSHLDGRDRRRFTRALSDALQGQ